MIGTDEAEDFMLAVHDLVQACGKLGIKPPTAISFHTGRGLNTLSEMLVTMKGGGNEMALSMVTVNAKGRVEIEGVMLTVAWL